MVFILEKEIAKMSAPIIPEHRKIRNSYVQFGGNDGAHICQTLDNDYVVVLSADVETEHVRLNSRSEAAEWINWMADIYRESDKAFSSNEAKGRALAKV